MNAILELSSVSKHFEKLCVVRNVNLKIVPGEIVALIGKSGSGKTTILQIAGLLDSPTFGTVMINGENCTSMGDSKKTYIRRNFLGFIYQFHYLLQEFSVIENVILAQLLAGRSKKEAYNSAFAVLAELGIENKAQSQIAQISGGERQRVAIARAIVNAPAMVLADEPTGNLDPNSSVEVFLLLQKYAKSHNIAILLVTHDHKLAVKADRILHIQDGSLSNPVNTIHFT